MNWNTSRELEISVQISVLLPKKNKKKNKNSLKNHTEKGRLKWKDLSQIEDWFKGR